MKPISTDQTRQTRPQPASLPGLSLPGHSLSLSLSRSLSLLPAPNTLWVNIETFTVPTDL